MVNITFLRHAEARHNADAAVRGDAAYFDPANADADLTDVGWLQTLDARSGSSDYDAIYCSPLRRCRGTLLGVIPGVGTRPVILDDRLMEPQGQAICNRRSERRAILGETPSAWICNIAEHNPYDCSSEEYDIDEVFMPKFCNRVRAFTEELRRSNHEHVLIVSHHDWIRVWFWLYKRERVSVANCRWATATLEKS
jgi:broad specificity phosphatase PhoE